MNRTISLRRRLLFKGALGLFIFIVTLLILKSLSTGQPIFQREKNRSKAATASESTTKPKLTTESISQSVDRMIAESELASARWGISVISLIDGREIYNRNADSLFTPASNMKVFTTGVALDLLGSDYRWRTSVFASKRPDQNGTVRGDLILYGRGAPDLVSDSSKESNRSLAQLAEDLYRTGVRRVSGNIVGDESYFNGEPLGDGWQWTDIQWYFGAEASALSINGNEIDVNILPPDKTESKPAVRLSDPVKYVSIQNEMVVVKPGERMTLGINRGLSDNNVRVWGQFPFGSRGFGARLAVHKPALWAAKLFHAALKAKGIVIDGEVQSRDARVPVNQRFNPSESVELAFVSSRPLSEIAKVTNKASVNLFAELILRTLGRERRNMVSIPDPPGRELREDEAGVAVMNLWLSRAGILTDGLALHDGSGLSRLNLVTPRATAKFLVALSKTSAAPVFRDSLPVSSQDGTLGGRLKELAGKVSAKTGSLVYVTSLSGYLSAPDGQVYAFSIFCNDHTARASANRLIDEIVLLLASPRQQT